ncbi:MAG: hypothetical protein AAGF20_08395 [Pseudomonadota bacterium]
MKPRLLVAALGLLGSVIAACSGSPSTSERPDIRPGAFALLPCQAHPETACALVVAGGKRVLIGAPAGAASTLEPEDLRKLDQALLFSLHGEAIEGLDEIRNASWRFGRPAPLPLAGPEGTGALAAAVNLTFEQADALHVVEQGMPTGGFDAALLIGRDVDVGETGFDTGDLVITYMGPATWEIAYQGAPSVILRGCQGPAPLPLTAEPSTVIIDCMANGDRVWPLVTPRFILR